MRCRSFFAAVVLAGPALAAGRPARTPIEPVAAASPPLQAAAGDVMVFSPHNGVAALPWRTYPGPLAGASDFYAVRFTTTDLARQLPPPSDLFVSAIWMVHDDYCSWDAAWPVSVVLEGTSPATAYHPDLANPAATLTSTTFDMSTLSPPFPRGTGPSCGKPVNLRIDLADAAYPASARFAVEDGASDDDFTRASDGPLTTYDGNGLVTSPWIECIENNPPGFGCLRDGIDQTIQVRGNVAVAAAGTALAWRLPVSGGDCRDPFDPSATVDCYRYLRDYVDIGLQSDRFVPDDDVRLTVRYDLTASGAGENPRRAGLFFRADYTLGGVVPSVYQTLRDFYAVVVERDPLGSHQVKLVTHAEVESRDFSTPLAAAPLANLSGTLTVEVSGADPVEIRAYLDGNLAVPVLSFSDASPARRFRGDQNLGPTAGNIYGLLFPDAGGGERLDDFSVARNADLFAVVQFPPGRSPAVWTEGDEGGREFFNTFYTGDATRWMQLGGCQGQPGCGDCTRTLNSMISLEVFQGLVLPDDILHQVNNTVSTVYLACGCSATNPVGSSCLVQPFSCDQSGSIADRCACNAPPNPPCAVPPPPAAGVRAVYEVGKPIEVMARFTNEHARDGAPPQELLIGWVACDLGGDPFCPNGGVQDLLLGTCNGGAVNPNCGYFTIPLGPDLALGQLPGMTRSSSSDLDSPPDGRPDGPLYLRARGVAPQRFTPANPGDYEVSLVEVYDGFDANPGQTDPIQVDQMLHNNFLRRTIRVCPQELPPSLDRNSLWMVKGGAGTVNCAGNTTADIEATWRAQTPGPFDPTTPFKLHFVDGRAQLASECAQGTLCNPWSEASSTAPPAPGLFRCLGNPVITQGVGYYSVFQAIECTQTSRGDCSGVGMSCRLGTDCCSNQCSAGLCQ